MDTNARIMEIKKNVILGHIDKTDEGFDGDMEGNDGVSELVSAAVEDNVSIRQILDSLSEAMEVVGQKHEAGEYLIPDMLASAECVGTAMDILEPHLAGENIKSKGTFVIATVEGDLHDIGKNIVATMIKGEGYDVKDLGVGVATSAIVDSVKQHNADFLGLSALLTTTMVHMESVIKELEAAGLRNKVKVLIGGAPTSPEFAGKIGADAHSRDAFAAIEAMRNLSGVAQ